MRARATILVSIFAVATVSSGTTNYLEHFSPRFSDQMPLIWAAPTNDLPASLWVYRRAATRPFAENVISNAIFLASLLGEKIPRSSTRAFYIWSEPDGCGKRRAKFSVQPDSATINFFWGFRDCLESNPLDSVTVKARAVELAACLGLDREQLDVGAVFNVTHDSGCDDSWTNCTTGRGIYLARKLDGVPFFGGGGDGSEGFTIEFGKAGRVNAFSFVWPDLSRDFQSQTATPQEIIRCIKLQRILMMPDRDEPNYFARMRNLTNAMQFTIAKILPRYIEGQFGVMTADDAQPQTITPVAELEAVAAFPNSNVTVHLIAPLVASDVQRLMNAK